MANVPLVVTGEPDMVNPVGTVSVTLVTVPLPAGVDQVPSPRQYVVLEADVPLLRLPTGKLPVTPELSGRPVAFVRTPLAGVPKAGVTNVGEVASTALPVPVTANP